MIARRAMNKSKWIKTDSPDEPVEEVARTALDARLDKVWHYLAAAADEPKSETENVHQLRVASRRAAAAMRLFAPLLPPRHARWINKQLKKIRRAAGDARDLDVLGDQIARFARDGGPVKYQFLCDAIKQRRHAAQEPIADIHSKLKRKDFRHRQARLVKHTRLRTEADREQKPSYAQVGREALAPLVQCFLTASTSDFSDYERLHAFRIEGKRLRYAMEVFAGAFSPGFRKDLYKQIEELQQKLGDVNDHVNARQQFSDSRLGISDQEATATLNAMVEAENAAVDSSRQEFLDWWTEERREQLRRDFEQYLFTEVSAAGD
jgi:CHAD domain-containing protein